MMSTSVTTGLSCSAFFVGVVDAAARSTSLLRLFFGSVACVRLQVLVGRHFEAKVVCVVANCDCIAKMMNNLRSIDHPYLLVSLS